MVVPEIHRSFAEIVPTKNDPSYELFGQEWTNQRPQPAHNPRVEKDNDAKSTLREMGSKERHELLRVFDVPIRGR